MGPTRKAYINPAPQSNLCALSAPMPWISFCFRCARGLRCNVILGCLEAAALAEDKPLDVMFMLSGVCNYAVAMIENGRHQKGKQRTKP